MSRREQIEEKVRAALRRMDATIEAGGLDSITVIVKLNRTNQSPRSAIARAEWGDSD